MLKAFEGFKVPALPNNEDDLRRMIEFADEAEKRFRDVIRQIRDILECETEHLSNILKGPWDFSDDILEGQFKNMGALFKPGDQVIVFVNNGFLLEDSTRVAEKGIVSEVKFCGGYTPGFFYTVKKFKKDGKLSKLNFTKHETSSHERHSDGFQESNVFAFNESGIGTVTCQQNLDEMFIKTFPERDELARRIAARAHQWHDVSELQDLFVDKIEDARHEAYKLLVQTTAATKSKATSMLQKIVDAREIENSKYKVGDVVMVRLRIDYYGFKYRFLKASIADVKCKLDGTIYYTLYKTKVDGSPSKMLFHPRGGDVYSGGFTDDEILPHDAKWCKGEYSKAKAFAA